MMMNQISSKYVSVLAFIMMLMSAVVARAQEPTVYTLQGLVRDSVSHEVVPYAAVKIVGTPGGVLTDGKGRFKINASSPIRILEVSTMGYQTKRIKVADGAKKVRIDLLSTGVQLGEVVVKPKKEKYSKKNNPAVAFVRKIRDARDMNDPRKNHKHYNYDKYERISIALNNISPEDNKNLLLKKFKFLKESIDTSEVSGKPILGISTREKMSQIRYDKELGEKEVVSGVRQEGLDDFLDEDNMRIFYDNLFPEIDLYSNDIVLLQNRFVSPLARIAPDFYKFYLTDTVDVNGERCVELAFVPHNSQSFGFTGKVYVPMGDSTMFIKKVAMNVPVDINLNFIDRLYINQEFERAPDGSRLLVKDDLIAEVNVLPMMQGLYFRRNSAYSKHNFNEAEDKVVFGKLGRQIMLPEAEVRTEKFWEENRLIPYTQKEKNVGQMARSLRSNKLYYWGEKFIKIMVVGYVGTSKKNSKFDIGPVNNTISSNYIEGARLRFGGLTTAHLNRHIFAGGYVAYGFKDHKWKYHADLEYSFNEKQNHANEFPIHSIKLGHTFDVNRIGQRFVVTNPDNMFLSIKRHPDKQMTYHRVTQLDYTLELTNNFSVKATWKHERQEATGYMRFIDGYGREFGHFNEASFKVQLRYAPGEKFYQTKTERRSLNKDAPIITLSHTYAPKGFMGTMYDINCTELSLQKRFWLSAFGCVDVLVKGAHLWSKSSYPDLLLPNANLSYTIQPESFALLNPMELVTDSYVSWDLTYWARGAIFNYIPLFKKLKLREVFSFRGVFGHLSEKNNPANNPDLFRFPEVNHTMPIGRTPYMEVGVGVDNIFKVLRLDYVWRLTYRNNPGADRGGLRLAMHFTF